MKEPSRGGRRPREEPAGRTRGRHEGPGVRHERGSAHREAPARARRAHLLLLLGALRGEVRGGAGDIPRTRARARPSRRPRTPSTPARCIPRSSRSARATARSAAWRSSRRWSLLEEEGPSAEYLDMRRRFWVSAALSLPLLIWVMGEHLLGWHGSRHPAADGALAPARARDAGRALGRVADLQALLGIVPEAQPQHVDLDRDRRRRRLPVQRGRDARARDLPGGLPWATRARSTSTSRPRR